jgi:PKD repeat protein/subtilisin family serine protease
MHRRILLSLVLMMLVSSRDAQAADSGARFHPAASGGIPGEYIVVLAEGRVRDPLRPGSSGPPVAAEARRLAALYGVTVERFYEHALPGFSMRASAEAARLLAADPAVRLVEQNAAVAVSAVDSCDPLFQNLAVDADNPVLRTTLATPQPIACPDPDPIRRNGNPGSGAYFLDCIDNWGLDVLDGERNVGDALPDVYQFSATGQGVHVYLLDLGIDASHPEFLDLGTTAAGDTRIKPGFNAAAPDTDPAAIKNDVRDCVGNSHGTHVAAIVAGNTFGVAKRAWLHPVKFQDDCDDREYEGTRNTLINGIDWILRTHNRHPDHMGPAVVNFSGGNGGDVETRDSVMAFWVRRLMSAGIGIVQSAGNQDDRPQAVTGAAQNACLNTLAQHPQLREGLIVAGAVDETGLPASRRYHRWVREGPDPADPSYPLCEPDSRHDCGSNSGACADDVAGVDIWAPGAHIVSAKQGGGACRLSGTSMAAPHVTGAAALLLERFPQASPAAVEAALVAAARAALDTTTLRGGPNRLLHTGFPTTGPPIAGDDWFATPPGVPLVMFVDELLRGDLDWDRDPLQLAGVGEPAHGVLELGSDRLTYLPAAGFTGLDSFTYTVSDGRGGTDQATIHVEVTQPPQPPTARDDCSQTPAGMDLDLGTVQAPAIFGNDAGERVDSLVADPPHGRIGQLNHPSDTYLYRPDPGFTGTDTFAYFIWDSYRQKSSATVTIHVGGGSCPVVNQPPVPLDDAFTTPFNSSRSFLVSTLLANDTDPDGDEVFFDGLVGDQPPSHGFLSVDGIGPEDIIYRYHPDPGFVGTDSFGYQVSDEQGATARATVRFTVTTAGFGGNPDLFLTTIGGRLRVFSGDLLANDSAGAVFVNAGNPRHGDLVIAGIGPEGVLYDFYPTPGFTGEAGFDYRISPNGSEPYTVVQVVIQVVDGEPVAGILTNCAGVACSFDASRSSDDVGIDSYAWTFGDGTTGSGRTVSHTYDPAGRYAVTLTVTDTAGHAASDSQVVTADPLPAASFTFTCTGRTCTFDASGSTDNGGSLGHAWAFGDGATGSGVTVSHTYQTSGAFNVVLTVTDTVGQTASAARAVLIDLPPVACFTVTCTGLTCTFDARCSTDDVGIGSSSWVFGDGTFTGSTLTRTFTASGLRTVTLTVTDTRGQQHSTSRTFNPDAPPVANFTWSCVQRTCNFDGRSSTDNAPIPTYNWTFGDGTTGSGAQVTRIYQAGGSYQVRLTVIDAVGQSHQRIQTVAVNRPPAAASDTATTQRDTPVDLNVLANDSDPDGDPLNVTSWTQPAQGTVTKNPNGTLRFTPAAGYTGAVSPFTYTASDGRGDVATATVSVTVTVPNNPPDARDDGWSTYQNGPTGIPLSHLLANDYDPNGDALVVTGINTAGLTGTLDCSSGTVCWYTPPSWFRGTTSFTYSASDGKGGTDPATVRIKVGLVNGPPAPQDDFLETSRGVPLAISRATLLANDTDPDGDVLSITQVVRQPLTGFGTVSCSAGFYTCTYTPAAGFTGVDVLFYRASDGITFTDARIRILVRPSNPATLDAREDQIFTTTNPTYIPYSRLLLNDYDPEGGPLTLVGIDTAGLLGTLDCTTFSTGCDYYRGTNDPTRFRYTVRDPQGNLDTTTVTLKPGNRSFNQIPQPAADQLTTRRNTPLPFSIFDLLRNDLDPDNDQLNIAGLWFTQNGRISCTTPTYFCTYTPNANFVGVDTFTYSPDDGNNNASATVTINVNP